ncbi:MAG: hypothetical protein WC227_00275 [Patescibacteria group bacterium]
MFTLAFYHPEWGGRFRFAALLSGVLLFLSQVKLRYIVNLLIITTMALLLFFKKIPAPYLWLTSDDIYLSTKLIVNYLYFAILIVLPVGLFNFLIWISLEKNKPKKEESREKIPSFYFHNDWQNK